MISNLNKLTNILTIKQWIPLLIIFIIAIILRLNLAISLPIWIDESIVFNLANNNSYLDLISGNYWDSSHPPLLHLITKTQLFFINENNLLLFRIFHILFSSLTIIPIAVFIKKISKSNLPMFLGTLLYAVHPLIVRNTFSVRPYSLLVFCFGLILTVNIKKYIKEHSIKKLIGLNIFIVFCFYLSYASIWFLVPFFLLTIYEIKNIKLLLKYFWPSIILIGLWIPNFVNNFSQLQKLNLYAKDKTLQYFFEELIGIVEFWQRSELLSLFGYSLYVFTFLISLVVFYQTNKYSRKYLIYLVFPIIFIFIYSQITSPAYISRQFLTLAVIWSIYFSSLAKKKIFLILAVAVIFFNLFQSIILVPNFRYLSFNNYEKITYNMNEEASILYPYYNLDSLDYLLRNSGYIRVENSYDPVVYNKGNQMVFAYVSPDKDNDKNYKKYFLLHKQDLATVEYFKNIEIFCNISKTVIIKRLEHINDFSFLTCE